MNLEHPVVPESKNMLKKINNDRLMSKGHGSQIKGLLLAKAEKI